MWTGLKWFVSDLYHFRRHNLHIWTNSGHTKNTVSFHAFPISSIKPGHAHLCFQSLATAKEKKNQIHLAHYKRLHHYSLQNVQKSLTKTFLSAGITWFTSAKFILVWLCIRFFNYRWLGCLRVNKFSSRKLSKSSNVYVFVCVVSVSMTYLSDIIIFHLKIYVPGS